MSSKGIHSQYGEKSRQVHVNAVRRNQHVSGSQANQYSSIGSIGATDVSITDLRTKGKSKQLQEQNAVISSQLNQFDLDLRNIHQKLKVPGGSPDKRNKGISKYSNMPQGVNLSAGRFQKVNSSSQNQSVGSMKRQSMQVSQNPLLPNSQKTTMFQSLQTTTPDVQVKPQPQQHERKSTKERKNRAAQPATTSQSIKKIPMSQLISQLTRANPNLTTKEIQSITEGAKVNSQEQTIDNSVGTPDNFANKSQLLEENFDMQMQSPQFQNSRGAEFKSNNGYSNVPKTKNIVSGSRATSNIRKKRNLYTSLGNYNSNVQAPQTSKLPQNFSQNLSKATKLVNNSILSQSGTRFAKRLQNNFLEVFEQATSSNNNSKNLTSQSLVYSAVCDQRLKKGEQKRIPRNTALDVSKNNAAFRSLLDDDNPFQLDQNQSLIIQSSGGSQIPKKRKNGTTALRNSSNGPVSRKQGNSAYDLNIPILNKSGISTKKFTHRIESGRRSSNLKAGDSYKQMSHSVVRQSGPSQKQVPIRKSTKGIIVSQGSNASTANTAIPQYFSSAHNTIASVGSTRAKSRSQNRNKNNEILSEQARKGHLTDKQIRGTYQSTHDVQRGQNRITAEEISQFSDRDTAAMLQRRQKKQQQSQQNSLDEQVYTNSSIDNSKTKASILNELANQQRYQIQVAKEIQEQLAKMLTVVFEDKNEDIDQEDFLKMIGSNFETLQEAMHPSIGQPLALVKKSYETLLDLVCETYAKQTEELLTQMEAIQEENLELHKRLSEEEENKRGSLSQNQAQLLAEKLERVQQEKHALQQELKQAKQKETQHQKHVSSLGSIQSNYNIKDFKEQDQSPMDGKPVIPPLNLRKVEETLLKEQEQLAQQNKQKQELQEVISEDPEGYEMLEHLEKVSGESSFTNSQISLPPDSANKGRSAVLGQHEEVDSPLTKSAMLKKLMEADEKDNNGRRVGPEDYQEESNDHEEDTPPPFSATDSYYPSDVEGPREDLNRAVILNQKGPHGFGINLAGIKKTDFQDDFMAKYDEFSESWRQACKDMRSLKL